MIGRSEQVFVQNYPLPQPAQMTQVAVVPGDSFRPVGHSSPGSVHDLMPRLHRAGTAMMDKGYDGFQKPAPK